MNRMAKWIGIVTLAGACFLGVSAWADASSLQSALQHLQAARNDLEASGKGKGGVNKEALDLVGQAIEKVRKSIEKEKQQKK
jgi:hypothetical protein